jgi:SAM-dependent methyltransferase
MRIYSDLAPWFHLLTHPSDYEEEASYYTRVLEATSDGGTRTLLELGSGGGNNASYLKQRFECTLTDISSEMLALSQTINPECEHVQGDMRTLRLNRLFDAVFVHDSLAYVTSEAELGAAIATAAAHTRPGGVALFVPDVVSESFEPSTSHGGHDGPDGRARRYLEWTTDPEPSDTTYDTDFVIVLREPGRALRIEHDHHTCGRFPRETWLRLLRDAGLEPIPVEVEDPYAGEHEVFVSRHPA